MATEKLGGLKLNGKVDAVHLTLKSSGCRKLFERVELQRCDLRPQPR